MPIYEYQCGACDHRLEALQKISDEPLRECPECSEPELKKLISPVAFRLKGSGWYETDFKSDNRRNVLDGDKGESKAGGKAEAGSEAKPEKKTEPKPAKTDAPAAGT